MGEVRDGERGASDGALVDLRDQIRATVSFYDGGLVRERRRHEGCGRSRSKRGPSRCGEVSSSGETSNGLANLQARQSVLGLRVARGQSHAQQAGS